MYIAHSKTISFLLLKPMSAVRNEARPINKLGQCPLCTLSETLKMTIS